MRDIFIFDWSPGVRVMVSHEGVVGVVPRGPGADPLEGRRDAVLVQQKAAEEQAHLGGGGHNANPNPDQHGERAR